MNSDPGTRLRECLEMHRTARELDLKGAALYAVRLPGLRADGLNLEEADLRNSCLTELRWKACNLRDARLDGADFTGSVLRLCDLDQARASGAVFVRTRFENSSARGARLDEADFSEATLTDSDFSRASLAGATLAGASASGANFRGANLRGARLRNAVLIDADLRGADLAGADLAGADLAGADLDGADLDGADFHGADVSNADLSEVGVPLPPELRALSATISPIVAEVLRTAGQRGMIDADTAARLAEQTRAIHGRPAHVAAPNPETLAAVMRVLEELGGDAVPKLLGALQAPDKGGPPADIEAMLLRLGQEFSLGDKASAEAILERLTRRPGR